MNLLDLYEGREPYQQAIDKLEQARIDHLKEKMDYYAEHGMVEQFKKAKAEHDSYFKVQDECMGYGSVVGEAGIGQDIVNKTEKMARATPSTPTGKVASTVKNAAKWLAGKGGPGKEGPTYEEADQKKNSEDPKLARLKTHARHEHPQASTDDEALALHILDKEQSDVDQLQHENDREDRIIEKLVDIEQKLQQQIDQLTATTVDEGWQDFNKVEPYEVCLAGKPVKTFDYYEDARRFHDNWKKKLYAQGQKEKADRITLNPVMKEATNRHFGPKGAGTELARQIRGELASAQPRKGTPVPAKEFARGIEKDLQKAMSKPKIQVKKSQVKEFAPGAGRDDDFDPETANMAHQEGVVKGFSLVDGSTVEQALQIPSSQWGELYNGQYKQYFIKGFMDGRKAKLERARKDGVELSLQKDGSLSRIQQGVAEGEGRVDPILIKALNNMPNGLATHREVLDAAYDAYAMELGKMKMKTDYGVTNVYIPKLMSLYKDKHGLTFNEASNPAQQAAIAIAKKKEQGVAEAETDYSKRRQRERDIDAGKPVAKQRQPKMTDYQKRRAQQKKEMELGEDQDTSGVESAIIRRIMVAHTDLLKQFGPEKVMQAAEEVAYNVGDVDEIGSSDVSAWVHEVRQILGA